MYSPPSQILSLRQDQISIHPNLVLPNLLHLIPDPRANGPALFRDGKVGGPTKKRIISARYRVWVKRRTPTYSETLQLSTYEPDGISCVPAHTRFRDPASVDLAINSFINLQPRVSAFHIAQRRGKRYRPHLETLDPRRFPCQAGMAEPWVDGVDDDLGPSEFREGVHVQDVDGYQMNWFEISVCVL